MQLSDQSKTTAAAVDVRDVPRVEVAMDDRFGRTDRAKPLARLDEPRDRRLEPVSGRRRHRSEAATAPATAGSARQASRPAAPLGAGRRGLVGPAQPAALNGGIGGEPLPGRRAVRRIAHERIPEVAEERPVLRFIDGHHAGEPLRVRRRPRTPSDRGLGREEPASSPCGRGPPSAVSPRIDVRQAPRRMDLRDGDERTAHFGQAIRRPRRRPGQPAGS